MALISDLTAVRDRLDAAIEALAPVADIVDLLIARQGPAKAAVTAAEPSVAAGHTGTLPRASTRRQRAFRSSPEKRAAEAARQRAKRAQRREALAVPEAPGQRPVERGEVVLDALPGQATASETVLLESAAVVAAGDDVEARRREQGRIRSQRHRKRQREQQQLENGADQGKQAWHTKPVTEPRACRVCGQTFWSAARDARQCDDCRSGAVARAAARREAAGVSTHASWPPAVQALVDRVGELEDQAEVAPPDQLQAIRRELMMTTARLEVAKAEVLAGELPDPGPRPFNTLAGAEDPEVTTLLAVPLPWETGGEAS
jgi:hypothetical protein